MVYLPPPYALTLRTNRTNADPTINFLFIFLNKPSVVLGINAMSLLSGTVSNYSVY